MRPNGSLRRLRRCCRAIDVGSAHLRYWHTVRHLRPVQIYGRLWFRLKRPKPDLSEAPPLREAAGVWTSCARQPSMLGPNRFRFLSAEREIGSASCWNRSDWPKLGSTTRTTSTTWWRMMQLPGRHGTTR
jgi:hypothetical protein